AQGFGLAPARLGDRAKWRVDTEREVGGLPRIARPAIATRNFTRGVGLYVRSGMGVLHVVVHRAGHRIRANERQTADRAARVASTLLHADEQVLRCGFADLDANAAAGSEVAAREAHERARGRVLSVEIDVAGKGGH